jgi:hypothetical protein
MENDIMRATFLTLFLLATVSIQPQSTNTPTSQVPDLRHGTLDSFIGRSRLLLVIDMHADDSVLIGQWTSLANNAAEFNKRNVTVIPILAITSAPLPPSRGLHTAALAEEGMANARQRYQCSDVDFCVILIDVDGQTLYRSTTSVKAKVFLDTIDAVIEQKKTAE